MRDGHRRVFLSHTAEVRQYPRERSFVAAAEAAVQRAQFVAHGMADFSARDQRPGDYCKQAVGQVDVFVGIIGLRYGSPVRDRPDVSYTELEFETATERGIPRFMFLLDESAELPLPASQIKDDEYGTRQTTFRRRIEEAGVTAVRVSSPEQLELQVYQALVEHSRRDAVSVHERFPNDIFIRYVKVARQVTILNTWSPNLGSFQTALVDAVERQAEVRILLLFPYSGIAEMRDTALLARGMSGLDPSVNVADGVQHNLQILESIARRVDADARSRLAVKVYNSQPSIAVYRADERYLVSWFLHGRLAIDSSTFEINSSHQATAKDVQDELDRLWTIGYDVDPLHWSRDLEDIRKELGHIEA